MTIASMLPLGELTNPGQMRLALVQVVNWGGTFHGGSHHARGPQGHPPDG